MQNKSGFTDLTPDVVHLAVEEASGVYLTGLISPFPSYINRVYEVETEDGEKLVAKFYRPGRWSEAALREEHEYLLDCSVNDIPVVSPLKLIDGDTLGKGDLFICSFPKKPEEYLN